MSKQDPIFSICGCCEGPQDLIPLDLVNMPGLSGLNYRVGTHNRFKQSMLLALSRKQALVKLTSRDDDDMAVATLDAWASVLDVLSFYQERIINEGYLRTATERRSILELARHISYMLGPGVAASTYLAFSMNEAPGAPASAVIPIGTQVQSIPKQDQLPQLFETIEEIEARVDWNGIGVQTKRRNIPLYGAKEIYLDGINTGLQPGDGILMIGDERKGDEKNENWDFRKVKTVNPDNEANNTRVSWNDGLGKFIHNTQVDPAGKNFKVYALRLRANLFGYNAPDFRTLSGSVKSGFLSAGIRGEYYNDISFGTLSLTRTDANISFDWGAGSPAPGIGVDTFSVRWSGLLLPPVTGQFTFYTSSDDGVKLWIDNQIIINNPTTHGLTEDAGNIWLQAGQLYSIRLDYFENTGSAVIRLSWSGPGLPKGIIPAANFFQSANSSEWPDFTIAAIAGASDTIHLDAIYSKIIQDSWLVVSKDNYSEVYTVADVVESSRNNFTLSSKTTAIKLSGENLAEKFDTHVRDAIVFAQSEELKISEMPVHDFLKNGREITLEKLIDLPAGKNIILSGKRRRLQLIESDIYPDFVVTGDPIATRELNAGDTLIVMKNPKTVSGNKLRWTLMDDNGNEGTIVVSNNKFILIASDRKDEAVSELHTIASLRKGTNPTVIVLEKLVNNVFDPPTVVVYANVASSTHGETKQETLGSGNGSQVFQKFELKQNPLTFISANTASGIQTTLEIRVNDILWKEVPYFWGVGPKEKVFVTSINDEGKVTVQFGDGKTGSRLPAGTENVKATYRVGIGSGGMLDAGQLSMLLTPQLGVNKVMNPLETSGADDPEKLDDARLNAPLTVLTLDRIVSAKDFEDFTRAFAGIGKASADILWESEQQVVYITIASSDEGPVGKQSDLYKNLLQAIKKASHTKKVINVDNFKPLSFSVNAGIQTEVNYEFDRVKDKVLLALKDTFSFGKRDFGQDVTPAEVMAVIQGVEGVIYTDLELMNGLDPFATPHFRIEAGVARRMGDTIFPAELLVINENEISISQIMA